MDIPRLYFVHAEKDLSLLSSSLIVSEINAFV